MPIRLTRFACLILALFAACISGASAQETTAFIETPFEMYNVAWHPDGQRLAVATNEGVKLYDANLLLVDELGGFESEVMAVAWSPDGAQLAVGTSYGDGNTFIYSYIADSFELTNTLEKAITRYDDPALDALGYSPHTPGKPYSYYAVTALSWSPDGSRLVEVGNHTFMLYRGTATAYDTTTWTPLLEVFELEYGQYLEEFFTQADKIVWSPDGEQIAVTGYAARGIVHVLNATTFVKLDTFRSNDVINALEWLEDGRIVFYMTNWGNQPHNALISADGETRQIVSITEFTSGASYMASARQNGGNLVAIAGGGEFGIWDVPRDTRLFTTAVPFHVLDLDWSSAGRIAVASWKRIETIDVGAFQPADDVPTVTPIPTNPPFPRRTPTRTPTP